MSEKGDEASDHLNSVINLSAMRDVLRAELVSVFESMRGDTTLVLDPQLIGPIKQITKKDALQKFKGIRRLQAEPFDTPVQNVLYIVRPRMQSMRWIADHVKYFQSNTSDVGTGAAKNVNVFLVPRKTLICEKVLENEGVIGDVMFGEYALEMIPFDADVLSMELPLSFKECCLDGDYSSLYYIARALMGVQSMYGMIPDIKAKGKHAKAVCDMLERMKGEIVDEEITGIPPQIDSLILIDRQVDLITPLMMQLTYEGLVDELFGIKNGLVEDRYGWIPPPTPKGGEAPQRTINYKIPFNGNDKVFQGIRDLNINAVGAKLNERAKKIEESFKEKDNLKTVAQIKDFMKRLPGLQEEKKNLEIHIKIVAQVKEMISQRSFIRLVQVQQAILAGEEEQETIDLIEELIGKQENVTNVLRLLCLFSITNNGLKSKHYDFFKRELIQTYGFETTLTLNNLDKAGLLKKQEDRSQWPAVMKTFNLTERDPRDPMNLSVFAGYAPLSVRLIELAGDYENGASGWRSRAAALNTLPGPIEYGLTNAQPGRRVTMVFFIGGVTFAEVNALRTMSKQRAASSESSPEYLIATTKIINGNSFLETVYENLADEILP